MYRAADKGCPPPTWTPDQYKAQSVCSIFIAGSYKTPSSVASLTILPTEKKVPSAAENTHSSDSETITSGSYDSISQDPTQNSDISEAISASQFSNEDPLIKSRESTPGSDSSDRSVVSFPVTSTPVSERSAEPPTPTAPVSGGTPETKPMTTNKIQLEATGSDFTLIYEQYGNYLNMEII